MTASKGVLWTPERDAELLALVDEGLSYAAIGRRLGITKNAALGRAKRIGVALRLEPRRQVREPPAWTRQLYEPGCRYAFGHPGQEDFRFCGAKVTGPGEPWCAEHRALCVIVVDLAKQRIKPAADD